MIGFDKKGTFKTCEGRNSRHLLNESREQLNAKNNYQPAYAYA